MCKKLMDCRHTATHNPYGYHDLADIEELFSYSEELRKLIQMFFDNEAKYFDDLLDAYSLYMKFN